MEYHDILLDVNGLERNWRYDQGMDYQRTVPRSNQPAQREGFTLVELSIVLVIIGLLIGGILAAQSMIKSAQIHKSTREIANYGVLISNFKIKYNQLPGDSVITGGNNNGFIDYYEGGRVWQSLSVGVGLKNIKGENYLPISFPGDSPTILQAPRLSLDQYIPPSLDNQPSLIIQGVSNVNYLYYVNHKSSNVSAHQTATYDPLRPADVFALDRKIDDGLPSTAGSGWFSSFVSGPGQCSSATAYYTTNNYVCAIRMNLNGLIGE